MRRNLALLSVISAVVLLAPGCRENATNDGPSPSASPTSTMFSGQSLPSKVDRLTGTPYYTNSPELASKAKIDGAPFLLMAPQDPTQALLVIEQGSSPADLVGRPSKLSDFSGVTETLEAPELAKFVKDEVALDLKKDESGKIVVLKVPMSAVPAPATPTAPTTPAVIPPPLASPSPGAAATPIASPTQAASATPVATPGARP